MNLAYYLWTDYVFDFPFSGSSTDESWAMVQRVHQPVVLLDLAAHIRRYSQHATAHCSLFVETIAVVVAFAVKNGSIDESITVTVVAAAAADFDVTTTTVPANCCYQCHRRRQSTIHNSSNKQPLPFWVWPFSFCCWLMRENTKM